MAGRPAMFTVTVKMSFRYISTGSAPFSPTPNAADGVAGVKIAFTPFAKQSSKSVLISVRVTDPSRLIVEFHPSGLKFAAGSPARLRFELAETDSDLNGDGVTNSQDDSLKTQLSFWRQEAPGQPWLKVVSAVFTDLNEVEADVLGFTGYALAY